LSAHRILHTWTTSAPSRFRSLILERLRVARDAGELDPELDPEATAMLLAAALDGLLVHRLVDPTLELWLTLGFGVAVTALFL
jgi:BetI-type transcriptional repressor, C-terminal